MITMYRDRIVEEVREERRKLLEESGGTIKSLVARIQALQRKHRRRLVRLPSKRAKLGKRGAI